MLRVRTLFRNIQWVHAADVGLVAVLVRLLWPRMRKRSGRLGGKGAPGSARGAILNFLAALQPQELRPLLLLFLHPLGVALSQPQEGPAGMQPAEQGGELAATAAGDHATASAVGQAAEDGLFEEPWWAACLGARDAAWWLGAVDSAALRTLPGRQRIGFLNAMSDLLQHLVSCRFFVTSSLSVALLTSTPYCWQHRLCMHEQCKT
jgi:U3 small nucleolar RNA-associated protein 20